jgi:hypothetical protein
VSGPERDPWADPTTPTEPGAPYAGPPPSTAPPPVPPPVAPPPGYPMPGYPGYGPYGYPPPGYGYPPPWPVVPRGPKRPGQVIASAVLAFVQATLVIFASLYVWFFASIVTVATAGAPTDFDAESLATEGTVLSAVQVLSAVLLVTAGVLALNRRNTGTWRLLVAAHAVQVVLALYWLVRLLSLTDDLPGAEADGVLITLTLFFAAGPAVGLGLLLAGASRGWFAAESAPRPTAA